MNNFGSIIGQKIYNFYQWAVQTHPGKFFGTMTGLVLSFLIIILGFWKTLLLILLSSIGFYLGKLWDEGRGIPSWLDNLAKRIRNFFK